MPKIEQTVEEVAAAMKECPEEWAELYINQQKWMYQLEDIIKSLKIQLDARHDKSNTSLH